MNNFNKHNILSKLKDGVKLSVKIVPNSSKNEIIGVIDNALKIKLESPPVEGKANEQCIKFLSKLLNIPKTSISITSGEKSKNKTLLIKGNPDKLYEKMMELFN